VAINDLWAAEGKTFKLLRLRENVVGIQISAKPDKNNDGKQDKGRAIVHSRKKGQQKNPKGNIISCPDQGEGMHASLFD